MTLFSVYNLLLTNEIRENIHDKMYTIMDSSDWSEFDIGLNMNDIDLPRGNFEEVLQERNMCENIAKLSVDLINDFEYYKQFVFESRFENVVYRELLEDLGYMNVDGQWRSVRRPVVSSVERNVFMYCLLRSLVYEIESGAEESVVCFFCGFAIGQGEERCQLCDSSIEEIKIHADIYRRREGGKTKKKVEEKEESNYDWKCVRCEFMETHRDIRCCICGEEEAEYRSRSRGACENEGGDRDDLRVLKDDCSRGEKSTSGSDVGREDADCINEETDWVGEEKSGGSQEGARESLPCTCPECGAMNTADNVVCLVCGEDVSGGWICEICANRNDNGLLLCDVCRHSRSRNTDTKTTDSLDRIDEDSLALTREQDRRRNVEIVTAGSVADEMGLDVVETASIEGDEISVCRDDISVTSDTVDDGRGSFSGGVEEDIQRDCETALNTGSMVMLNVTNGRRNEEHDDEEIKVERNEDDIIAEKEDVAPHVNTVVPVDSWECVKCGFFNKLVVSVCDVCNSVAPHVGRWVCEMCTYLNDLYTATCEVCHHENVDFVLERNDRGLHVSSIQKQRTNSNVLRSTVRGDHAARTVLSARRSRSWMCQYCSRSNSVQSQTCISCGMKIPDLTNQFGHGS